MGARERTSSSMTHSHRSEKSMENLCILCCMEEPFWKYGIWCVWPICLAIALPVWQMVRQWLYDTQTSYIYTIYMCSTNNAWISIWNDVDDIIHFYVKCILVANRIATTRMCRRRIADCLRIISTSRWHKVEESVLDAEWQTMWLWLRPTSCPMRQRRESQNVRADNMHNIIERLLWVFPGNRISMQRSVTDLAKSALYFSTAKPTIFRLHRTKISFWFYFVCMRWDVCCFAEGPCTVCMLCGALSNHCPKSRPQPAPALTFSTFRDNANFRHARSPFELQREFVPSMPAASNRFYSPVFSFSLRFVFDKRANEYLLLDGLVRVVFVAFAHCRALVVFQHDATRFCWTAQNMRRDVGQPASQKPTTMHTKTMQSHHLTVQILLVCCTRSRVKNAKKAHQRTHMETRCRNHYHHHLTQNTIFVTFDCLSAPDLPQLARGAYSCIRNPSILCI